MSSSDDETFSSQFGALDELIQLIYQGPSKFVVLSSISDSGWSIHLGLTGSGGRWWEGTWTERNFNDFVGHKTSSKLVDTFVEHLAKAFVNGQLFIGDWSSEKDAKINLTVGSTAQTPVLILLTEMVPQAAAAYAMTVFADIASVAQERQCKLNPPAYQVTPMSTTTSTRQSSAVATPKRKAGDDVPAPKPKPRIPKAGSSKADTGTGVAAQAKIKELEAELAKAQKEVKRKTLINEAGQVDNTRLMSRAKNNQVPAARPAKGASLANPNKKARKIKDVEFED